MRRGGKRDRIGDFYKEELKGVSHFQILLKTLPYLWPKYQYRLRFEFLLSILFMIAASASELYAPIPMRMIILTLTPSVSNNTAVNGGTVSAPSIRLPVRPVIIYGLVRIGQALFPVARDVFFASVAAYTERTIALQTFHHLQTLSLSFHLRRETGAILRSVSRGAGTYSSLVKSTTFLLVPMLIRLIGICIIFALLYRWYFITLTVAIIVVYSVYALLTTKWRDKYRKIMNEKDNQYNTRVTGKIIL
jgi:ABC-type multidrug transport system fused ATPase/permease subunit